MGSLATARGAGAWRCCGSTPLSQSGNREAVSLFDAVEHSQEMLALSQRNVLDQLLQEIKRQPERFRVPPVPKRSGSLCSQAADVDPHKLFNRLVRKPTDLPVTVEVAESLVMAMEQELLPLQSPVLDLKLPEGVKEPRMIVVGDTHGQLADVLHIFKSHGTPSPSLVYLFNGDIVDRGRYAVEIWLMLIAFKLKFPQSVHVLRGNHENEQMITRPLRMGGGFAEECTTKYGRTLLGTFQRLFKLLPLFAVVEEEIFVVHGGLFRSPSATLARLRALPEVAWKRNYPNPLTVEQTLRGEQWSEEEAILFDAQWADPHFGSGSKPSVRGRVAVTFGEDVTHRFLDDARLALCIRSHRVPQSGRGFDWEHGGRLLTLFSASRYGGVLHNRGAVAILEPPCLVDGTVTAPLRRLRMSLVEHDITPQPVDGCEKAAEATAGQVRRYVEQQVRELQADLEQHAVGLICAEREELWQRCRKQDVGDSGLVPREFLYGLLDEVCGALGWQELLKDAAPGLGCEVSYGEFLAVPSVRWFHLGTAQVVTMARATAQAELRLSGLAALFDSLDGDIVTSSVAREALRRLLPGLREGQLRRLAVALFGDEPMELSGVLHQLTLFADPPKVEDPWMQQALDRIVSLVECQYGPAPLHRALLRFFRHMDTGGHDLVAPDDFVRGCQSLRVLEASGDGQVPLLHAGRLQQLFQVMDSNRTGTVSFLELLLAMGERSDRPVLPELPGLEGLVPALLLVHKVTLLRLCRALDPLERGRVSAGNFLELVTALTGVLGRPLGCGARGALEEELRGEDLAYAEALATFEVRADGGPWRLGQL